MEKFLSKSIFFLFLFLLISSFHCNTALATTTDTQSLQQKWDSMASDIVQQKNPAIARMDKIHDTSMLFLPPLIKTSLLTFLFATLIILYRKIKKKNIQTYKIILFINFLFIMALYFLVYIISGTYGPMAPVLLN